MKDKIIFSLVLSCFIFSIVLGKSNISASSAVSAEKVFKKPVDILEKETRMQDGEWRRITQTMLHKE